MMELPEITILPNDDQGKPLIGLLTQDGREYFHVRVIEDALTGGTEPAEEAQRFLKTEVTVLNGYQYNILLKFHEKTTALLTWRGMRQNYYNTVRTEKMEGIKKMIASAMRKWEKDNPKPGPDDRVPNEMEQDYIDDLSNEGVACGDTFEEFTCIEQRGHEGQHIVKTDQGEVTWDTEPIGARAEQELRNEPDEPTELPDPDDDAISEPEANDSEEAFDPTCSSRYEGFQCQLADPNHADEHEVTVGGALWHWTDETAEKLEEPQGTGRVATVETPF
jgi:hypothetical protein